MGSEEFSEFCALLEFSLKGAVEEGGEGDGSVPNRAFHFCSSAAGSSVLRVAISPARSSAAALKLCCAVLRFDEMLCAMVTSIRVSMCVQFAP